MTKALTGQIQNVPGAAVLLAAIAVVFTLTAPGFLTAANLANIVSQSSILLLLALPMTLIIMTEGLDLSVGAVVTLAAVALALVVILTGSIPLALLAAIVIGVSFGVANGSIVAFAGIPPFVATLGTMGIAQGLSLIVTDGNIVVGIPPAVRAFYTATFFGVPAPAVTAATAYAFTHLLLYQTKYGAYVVGLGGNREALTLAGISVRRALISVYALVGVYVGVAALLMTARLNSGHPTAGIGLEFEAIAAVAIGGTSFAHGKGTIFGTLVGVITVGVLRNGLNLLGVASALQVAAVGALVIASLFIDGFWSRKP